MKPLYEHDCDNCVYRGTIKERDVYTCNSKLFGMTVIVRYSSDGPDYSSSTISRDAERDLFNGLRIPVEDGICLTVGLQRIPPIEDHVHEFELEEKKGYY